MAFNSYTYKKPQVSNYSNLRVENVKHIIEIMVDAVYIFMI